MCVMQFKKITGPNAAKTLNRIVVGEHMILLLI